MKTVFKFLVCFLTFQAATTFTVVTGDTTTSPVSDIGKNSKSDSFVDRGRKFAPENDGRYHLKVAKKHMKRKVGVNLRDSKIFLPKHFTTIGQQAELSSMKIMKSSPENTTIGGPTSGKHTSNIENATSDTLSQIDTSQNGSTSVADADYGNSNHTIDEENIPDSINININETPTFVSLVETNNPSTEATTNALDEWSRSDGTETSTPVNVGTSHGEILDSPAERKKTGNSNNMFSEKFSDVPEVRCCTCEKKHFEVSSEKVSSTEKVNLVPPAELSTSLEDLDENEFGNSADKATKRQKIQKKDLTSEEAWRRKPKDRSPKVFFGKSQGSNLQSDPREVIQKLEQDSYSILENMFRVRNLKWQEEKGLPANNFQRQTGRESYFNINQPKKDPGSSSKKSTDTLDDGMKIPMNLPNWYGNYPEGAYPTYPEQWLQNKFERRYKRTVDEEEYITEPAEHKDKRKPKKKLKKNTRKKKNISEAQDYDYIEPEMEDEQNEKLSKARHSALDKEGDEYNMDYDYDKADEEVPSTNISSVEVQEDTAGTSKRGNKWRDTSKSKRSKARRDSSHLRRRVVKVPEDYEEDFDVVDNEDSDKRPDEYEYQLENEKMAKNLEGDQLLDQKSRNVAERISEKVDARKTFSIDGHQYKKLLQRYIDLGLMLLNSLDEHKKSEPTYPEETRPIKRDSDRIAHNKRRKKNSMD